MSGRAKLCPFHPALTRSDSISSYHSVKGNCPLSAVLSAVPLVTWSKGTRRATPQVTLLRLTLRAVHASCSGEKKKPCQQTLVDFSAGDARQHLLPRHSLLPSGADQCRERIRRMGEFPRKLRADEFLDPTGMNHKYTVYRTALTTGGISRSETRKARKGNRQAGK